MSAFVGGFDVKVGEVVVFEGLEGGVDFALVVGVEEAGGAGDAGGVEAGKDAEAAYEVDGGDDGAGASEFFLVGGEGHGASLAPEPDLGGGGFAAGDASAVDGVVGEDGLGAFHEIDKGGPVGSGGEVFVDALSGNVVGGLGVDVGGSVFPDDEVAVADAAVEVDVVVAEMFLEGGDEGVSVFGGDVSGGVIIHASVADGDEVAADGDIVGLEGDAGAGGFDGCASGVVFGWVVPEEAEVGDIAAGSEGDGDGVDENGGSGGGEFAHGGDVGRLKNGFAPE